ncbi:hypothetical protein RFM99_32340 [Mesorhizobium sp. VK4C]|uniref:hypothetical protein n=1 Tax=Mesorhizobium captivum TaxID=3072319 RepID=UPI002A24BA5F|nr:hypothetical protein [Mesorhizobium sp. VK4C]MDX8503055.1 hypothetical protein [Mesorhizobium sp. VK4C]
MGLDVPNVRLVIRWQQSASVEHQLHEFGRAGRDGKPSVAVMFHNGSSVGRDISRLRFMAEKQWRLRRSLRSIRSKCWSSGIIKLMRSTS